MTDRFGCNSCGATEYPVEKRRSKVTNIEIFMCKTCIESGFEPRQFLLIGYHSGDPIRSKAVKFIKNRLYFGETIELSEVL